jgi:dolichol-phosphate mannosyltransferase
VSTELVTLSVVVPTFNEKDNVRELVRLLHACLGSQGWEVIFVDDDSPDGTADAIREIALHDHRVRCIQRIGRRGLSSACVEGMLSSAAPYLAVMDADLQHDERLLPQMLAALKTGDLDIVVGSRYVAGGSVGDWAASRARMSRFATGLSGLVVKAALTDPMSGFFMLRRDVLTVTVRRLSAIGFKILVDIFASAPRPLRFRELAYEFRSRQAGESKLDSQAVWDYVMLLADKLFGRVIPVRFISFTLVGGSGIVIHLAAVALFFRMLGFPFVPSQAVATIVAMTTNFALNNVLTYRDMRLQGWGWLRGWTSFALVCGAGAVANVGVASYFFQNKTGWVLSALAGILVGAVWNYAVSSVFTWKTPKRT